MVEDEVDEGSPLGGTALVAGLVAAGLVVLQLPAEYLRIGWVPGCLAGALAPVAIALGAFALISENSPLGRRNARRGLALGVIVLLAQLAFLMVVVWLAGEDLQGLAVP